MLVACAAESSWQAWPRTPRLGPLAAGAALSVVLLAYEWNTLAEVAYGWAPIGQVTRCMSMQRQYLVQSFDQQAWAQNADPRGSQLQCEWQAIQSMA